jgi:D-serine deaminase-like pyridoxal phosphate-dependent protein
MDRDFSTDVGLQISKLETPALLLDLDVLSENIEKMGLFVEGFDKKLRPHVKTHKCSHIARYQLAGGAVGVCVAKLSEAEGLLKTGIKRILITSPVVDASKITRLIECAVKAPDLMVVIDNPENAFELNNAAKMASIKLKVLVDVDPGMGRTGVPFDDTLDFGAIVNSLNYLEFCGIQCYFGTVQHVADYQTRKERSLQVMRRAAELKNAFINNGFKCDILTGGGTGTFDIDCQVPEVTDLQVGSYCVMDAEYAAVGLGDNPDGFRVFEPALSVLTSVVSVNRDDFVTVDAGLKAIYYTPHAPPRVLDPAISGFKYDWFGDEHGKLLIQTPCLKPILNTRIRLSASHCDPTVNLYDCYHIVSGGRVIDIWPIDLRGHCR